MKGVLLEKIGGIENLEWKEMDVPELKPGEILVKVMACGVCNHDLINRAGAFPHAPLPRVIGHEIAGVVEKVGDGVKEFKVGDRVVNIMHTHCGECEYCVSGKETVCKKRKLYGLEFDGGYAEYAVGPESSWVNLPQEISFEEGSVIACAIGTTYHAIKNRAKLTAGETVLITGATGGVGIHSVQLASLIGAEVIAVTSSEDKIGMLKENGAHHVIVNTDGKFHEKVKEITKGKGVNAVLEIVGALTFESSVRSLAAGGRLIVVGNVNASSITISPAVLILKEIEFRGTTGCTREELKESIELVRSKKMKPVVSATLPMSEAAAGHKMLEERKVKGRIVLIP